MDYSLSLNHSEVMQSDDEELIKAYKNNSDRCNLIINYVPQDIDDNALRGMFAEFGEIIQAKIVRDKASKKSLGYGFVKFISEADALNAIDKMNGFPIGHKKIKVSYARVSSDEIKNCKLYVTNLPRSFTSYDVTGLFGQFGEIIECRLLKDRQSGVNKGVAFVQFNVRLEAERAMTLDGQYIEGADKPLIIKYAEDQHRKRDRRPIPLVPPRFRQEPSYLFQLDHLHPNGMLPQKSIGYSVGNGQAYLPVAVAMPYGGYQIKYTSTVSQPTGANWYAQMPQHQHPMFDGSGVPMNSGGSGGMISTTLTPQSPRHRLSQSSYEPLELESFQQQRAASTVFMTNPPRGPSDASYAQQHHVSVVVGRLPLSVDVAMLQDLFSPYGRVLAAHVEADEFSTGGEAGGGGGRFGSSCGRAYIEMESLAQAQSAVQALNGSDPFLREGLGPLTVDMFGRGRTRDQSV